ncbi:flagellar hook-length control protein FliK [Bradyrhizobium sp. CCH5-F6]|uniref:flagellar hook-length control protein FliK n=1 Tax=Bradyrhizobium sp. CCH5-F6 TaxID=1768753 RepID=UPI000769A7E4|nr:flagellar hook-length control protein FliK [Bradyrhizobium sp. CCH5-F6]
MVGRTSDVVASVQVASAQQKPARSQVPKDAPADDSFGSLVDSNTQAISNNAQAQDAAPRRSDSTSSSTASDRRPRESSSADQPSQSRASDDTDTSAPANNDKSDATGDPAKDAGKVKDKSETSDAKSADKSDETKGDDADGTDTPTAAVDAADPNAAANQASDAAASPLTIAAAGLAASASTAAQIAGNQSDTAGDKSAKAAGAEIDADTTTMLGETATGTPEEISTDTKANGGLIAAASQGTPKTSFKDAVAAQAQTDVSNIGQDTGKANTAATQAPGAATLNAATHAQADKPQADGGAADAKAAGIERVADAASGAPATHAHAGPQATVAPLDASAQAASAVQAPLTNTTSAATASTATLTATAATSAAIPINGVPIEIAAAIRAGKSRFDISLDPAELGKIDVRINIDRNGQVTSHLTVEKPETLSMLKQDAPQLQRALDDAGFKTGSNGLSFSLRDQNSSNQNSGQNNDNGGNARRLIVSEEESVPAAPVGRGYGRMLGSSSGVDIRV